MWDFFISMTTLFAMTFGLRWCGLDVVMLKLHVLANWRIAAAPNCMLSLGIGELACAPVDLEMCDLPKRCTWHLALFKPSLWWLVAIDDYTNKEFIHLHIWVLSVYHVHFRFTFFSSQSGVLLHISYAPHQIRELWPLPLTCYLWPSVALKCLTVAARSVAISVSWYLVNSAPLIMSTTWCYVGWHLV